MFAGLIGGAASTKSSFIRLLQPMASCRRGPFGHGAENADMPSNVSFHTFWSEATVAMRREGIQPTEHLGRWQRLKLRAAHVTCQ